MDLSSGYDDLDHTALAHAAHDSGGEPSSSSTVIFALLASQGSYCAMVEIMDTIS